jgi:K+-transporting ATPase A subunit
MTFESIIILFYGFDRCTENNISSIMYFFGFENNSYYRNMIILLIQLLFLRFLALIVLIIKANPFRNLNCKKSEKSHELEVKISNPTNAYTPGLDSYNEHKIKY